MNQVINNSDVRHDPSKDASLSFNGSCDHGDVLAILFVVHCMRSSSNLGRKPCPPAESLTFTAHLPVVFSVSHRRATWGMSELAAEYAFLLEHGLEVTQLRLVRQLLRDVVVFIEQWKRVVPTSLDGR